MGKIKSAQFKPVKSQPLAQQLEEDGVVRPKVKKPEPKPEEKIEVLDNRTKRKMLRNARRQQEKLEEQFGGPSHAADEDLADGYFQELNLGEGDELDMEKFMKKGQKKQRTLADYIEEKIQEKEQRTAAGIFEDAKSEVGSVKLQKLDSRVTQLFKGVGEVMSKYRSGKIPKAFKIIPSLTNWEQVLELTNPDAWTAASMYAATRLFVSNLKEKMAQRFFNLILLPRVRDDIAEYKKLNYHLYQALRKALFKPGAFMKGILLPLCEAGDCTLREAVIIGSVVGKNSVPLLHSAAAILRIADMEYSGACSIFLHILLKKNYALPYRVIDAVVDHMVRFRSDKRLLPVLWHQTLLCFVSLYKSDISSEQREALLDLIKVQNHWQMSEVIRKELFHAKPRDVEVKETGASVTEGQATGTSTPEIQGSGSDLSVN